MDTVWPHVTHEVGLDTDVENLFASDAGWTWHSRGGTVRCLLNCRGSSQWLE